MLAGLKKAKDTEHTSEHTALFAPPRSNFLPRARPTFSQHLEANPNLSFADVRSATKTYFWTANPSFYLLFWFLGLNLENNPSLKTRTQKNHSCVLLGSLLVRLTCSYQQERTRGTGHVF